jgi:hypothetical protein
MALTTCKDMEWWHERAQQAMERLKYIDAVQQGGIKKNTTSECWERAVLIA